MDDSAPGSSPHLASDAADPSSAKMYRRNGRPPSCEPCRKSKLRCDHAAPCGRCIRRRRVDQCFYHPNPLTKPHNDTRDGAPLAATISPYQHGLSPLDAVSAFHSPMKNSSNASPTGHILLKGPVEPVTMQQVALESPLQSVEGESRKRTEYFGMTSFSSILAHGLGTITWAEGDVQVTVQDSAVTEDQISQGCRVLSFLKYRTLIDASIAHWCKVYDGCGVVSVQPLVLPMLTQLWGAYGQALQDQDPVEIQQLSRQLWYNSQRPIAVNGRTTLSQWISSSTGPNIRWGVIGLIASMIGQSINELDTSDGLFKEHDLVNPINPSTLRATAKIIAEICRDCDIIDDLYLWFQMELFSLTGYLKGEGSYAVYREGSEMNNALIVTGIHQGASDPHQVPFFLAELRKRLIIAVYSNEVGLSLFLGRPPRLSHHYITMELPLDIEDHRLFELDGPESVQDELDENGYNKEGRVWRSTATRAFASFVPPREDILLLALGHHTAHETRVRAEVITKRLDAVWASLPHFLQPLKQGFTDNGMTTPAEVMFGYRIRQVWLTMELVLQLVLIRKAGADSGKLITTARTIMADLLSMMKARNVPFANEVTLSYLMASHGVRSAALVAGELVKQEQLPTYPEEPLLPRSQTIRDLTVFADRLGEVRPTSGVYKICEQGRKVITSILDEILKPPAAKAQSRPEERTEPAKQHTDDDRPYDTEQDARMVDSALWDWDAGYEGLFLTNDYDFVQWLEKSKF